MAERVLSEKNIQNLAIALAVVIAVMMLIIPLPTVLLDFFMAFNLLFSILVLLNTFYTRRTIDFSLFPTVLLVLTVFGLALNVSSTRLILAQGTRFDGHMIRAFSTFVVGSGGTEGLLIGFVIFIILLAVQGFVITKGATRTSEVAARFTLDAMAMKQAAIEAEYSNGAITQEEAVKRKMELQQESDFFGRMDGAAKFVSGNVKVGIFITVINLVVGIIFGMVLRNEAFSEAIQTYAALTIGDGLLSQMPSLLISVATGIIITRPASDDSLGSDIIKQLTQSSWIYFIGGGVIAVIGILPGFPWYLLIPMGGALFYLGHRLSRVEQGKVDVKTAAAQKKQQDAAAQPGLAPVVPLDPLSLELGFALIPLVDKEKGAELLERAKRIRQEAALDMGLVVPSIRIVDNMRLEPSEYCFKIRGVEVGKGKIRMGWYMCMNTGNVVEEIQGEKTVDPAFGLPAIWITDESREKAERAGYVVVDSPTIIATHLTEIIKTHAAEILGRQEVQTIIDSTKKDYPAVVEEVLKIFNLGEIQKVLRGLLRERVSIRNRTVILEALADYGPITKKTDVLIEKVRQALGRQICLQYADENHVLHVLTVAQNFLQQLLDARVNTADGPVAALDPPTQRAWINALSSSIVSAENNGFPPVILCPEEARIFIKQTSEREMPRLVVISIPEIPNDIKVESLGEVYVG